MANSLIFAIVTRLCLLLTLVSLLCNITNLSTKSKVLAISSNKRLSMRLVHHDSLVPHSMIKDRDRSISSFSSSMLRYAYLKAKAKGLYFPDDVRGDVIPGDDRNIFFVNITIGTPPISQLVILDTGSSLFWIQCQPCIKCKETPNPIYDPSKSSSYSTSSCAQAYCSKFISGTCAEKMECAYKVVYADKAYSNGVLGYENVTFVTSDDGKVVVPFVVFGCGRDNGEVLPVPKASGVFGLSADDSSILRSSTFQNSPKFSYCLGNVSDPTYTYGQLILGNESILQGQETPLILRNGLYFVTVEGIIAKFPKSQHLIAQDIRFDILIDSGTTYTFLPRIIFQQFRDVTKLALDKKFQSIPNEKFPDNLCYLGNWRRDFEAKSIKFPIVTFEFTKGALLELDAVGLLFQPNDNVFCLAVAPAGDDVSILGLVAQQYYNVGFDIDAKKVFLQSIDCRNLDS